MLPTLLRRFRGLALFAAVVGLAATVPLMEGMLNVCHGAVLSLVHSFEGLQHLISYAILAGELDEVFLLIGNFAPLRPWAKSAADVRAIGFSCLAKDCDGPLLVSRSALYEVSTKAARSCSYSEERRKGHDLARRMAWIECCLPVFKS